MDRPSARAPSVAAQVRTAVAGVQRFSPAFRYAFAIIATLAALLLKLALGPIILPSLYVPFYGAVLLSAWVGGVGPGILSSVLSFGIGQVLFVPPPGSQTAVVELAMVRDALFLIAAIGLSWGTAALRTAQGRVAKVLLEAHNELEAQVAVRTAELQAANQLLRESEGKFRVVAESGSVATCIFQGPEVRYVNPACAAITGYTRDELLHMNFWDVIHPEHRERLRDRGLARQRGEPVPAHDEVMIVTKSGETRWVEFSGDLIDFEGGRAVLGTAFDVTERRRAEAALRNSEKVLREQAQWLQSILNSLGEAVVVADAEGKLLYFNPVAERLHGRGLADIAPEDWAREYGVYLPDGTLVPPDEMPLARARRGVVTAPDQEFGVRAQGQDTVVPVSATATPMVSEDGSLLGGVVVYRDISNVKRAEALLRRNEERLKEAERLAHAGAWEWDLTSNEGIWSDEHFRIFGLEPAISSPPGDLFLAAILAEDRPLVERAIEESRAGTHPLDVEYRIRRPNGEIRYVHSRGEVVRDVAGKAVRMLGTVLDVTEQKRSESVLETRVAERTAELRDEIRQRQEIEAALRESEQRFRATFEQVAVGMAMVDSRGSWMMVNDQLCQLLGYSREELLQRSFLDITYEEDRAASLALVAQLVSGQRGTFTTEKRYVHKDGSLVWGSMTGSAVRNADGSFKYGIAVVKDISARKQAEHELKVANRRIVSILEDISSGFFALDEDWCFTYVNPIAAGLLERPAIDLVGKNIWTEVPELVGSTFYDQYHRVMNERVTVEVEAYYPPLNRWYQARGYPARSGMSVLFEDVTETHEQEVTTLSDILRALNAELDVAAAFPRVAAGLRALTQCDRSNLIFFDRDYDEATVIALSDARPDVGPGTRLRMDDIPAAADVVAGRPHFVPDLAVEPQSPIVRTTYADGFRSLVCLPLRGAVQVVGMLTLAWRKIDGANRAQLPLLNQVADAIALATEKSRLFEEVRAGRERLEALSHRLLEVQEAERQHIARELHDEIGQALTALKLSLDAVVAVSVDGAGDRLNDTRRQVDELLARVRNLALDLRPAMLDDLGLLPALLWLVERYAVQTGMQVNVEHRGLERRFSGEMETAAYRIVQEALTNVARHAGVQQVTVRAWSDSRTLSVQVVDRGAGFDAESALAAGLTSGVTGMRERAVLLGGHLTVETAVGKGTMVSAELPLNDAAGEVCNEVNAWP